MIYVIGSIITFVTCVSVVLIKNHEFIITFLLTFFWFLLIPYLVYRKYIFKLAKNKYSSVLGRNLISVGFKNYLTNNKYKSKNEDMIKTYTRIVFTPKKS